MDEVIPWTLPHSNQARMELCDKGYVVKLMSLFHDLQLNRETLRPKELIWPAYLMPLQNIKYALMMSGQKPLTSSKQVVTVNLILPVRQEVFPKLRLDTHGKQGSKRLIIILLNQHMGLDN